MSACDNTEMPRRRMKTYTAQSGYVYEYYFVGERDALAGDPDAPAREFIFDVTSDRKQMVAVSVYLKPDALAAWAAQHGRTLNSAEQYAAAKMRLLRGFDEMDRIREHTRMTLGAADIEGLLADLGID
jgi:hypothetical protein